MNLARETASRRRRRQEREEGGEEENPEARRRRAYSGEGSDSGSGSGAVANPSAPPTENPYPPLPAEPFPGGQASERSPGAEVPHMIASDGDWAPSAPELDEGDGYDIHRDESEFQITDYPSPPSGPPPPPPQPDKTNTEQQQQQSVLSSFYSYVFGSRADASAESSSASGEATGVEKKEGSEQLERKEQQVQVSVPEQEHSSSGTGNRGGNEAKESCCVQHMAEDEGEGEGQQEVYECPICMEEISEQKAVGRCRGDHGQAHLFHAHCLSHWIASSQDDHLMSRHGARCPVCRGSVEVHAGRLRSYLEEDDAAPVPGRRIDPRSRDFFQAILGRLGATENSWTKLVTTKNAMRVAVAAGAAVTAAHGFRAGYDMDLMTLARAQHWLTVTHGVEATIEGRPFDASIDTLSGGLRVLHMGAGIIGFTVRIGRYMYEVSVGKKRSSKNEKK